MTEIFDTAHFIRFKKKPQSPGTVTSSFYWAHKSTFHVSAIPPKDRGKSNLRNVAGLRARENRQCPKFQSKQWIYRDMNHLKGARKFQYLKSTDLTYTSADAWNSIDSPPHNIHTQISKEREILFAQDLKWPKVNELRYCDIITALLQTISPLLKSQHHERYYCLVFRHSSIKILAARPINLRYSFCGLPQSSQANAGTEF
jgi:hypothetical protein